MTLFWFVIGILAIISISRYNESDKLFWKLFISFLGGFATVVAVSEYISNKQQNKVEVVTNAPTQALDSASHTYCVMPDSSVTVSKEEKSSDPVSKDSAGLKFNLIRSKVAIFGRDQPTKPFDTS